MKVRIKATGEVFIAKSYAKVAVENYDCSGEVLEYELDEIELIPDKQKSDGIDWEQRRYEIAKDVLACRATTNTFEIRMDDAVHQAVRCADALIKRLKGE